MHNAIVGYASALLAVFMFGTNYIPVRRCETHDGLMFGWAMGNGALCVGLVGRIFFGGEVLSLGLLGGAIWSFSNALVLPVVKLLGLGVGFALYHGVNLVCGYLVGRLGLFGAPLDTPERPALSDCSVLLLVLSLFVMVAVEPDMSHTGRKERASEDARPSVEPQRSRPSSSATFVEAGEADEAGGSAEGGAEPPAARTLSQSLLPPQPAPSRSGGPAPSSNAVPRSGSAPDVYRATHAAAEQQRHAPSREPAAACSAPFQFSASAIGATVSYSQLQDVTAVASLFEASAPPPATSTVRKAYGVLLALFAGVLAGVNTVPFLLWSRNHRLADEPALHFLFANLLGVYAAASGMCARPPAGSLRVLQLGRLRAALGPLPPCCRCQGPADGAPLCRIAGGRSPLLALARRTHPPRSRLAGTRSPAWCSGCATSSTRTRRSGPPASPARSGRSAAARR